MSTNLVAAVVVVVVDGLDSAGLVDMGVDLKIQRFECVENIEYVYTIKNQINH